MSARSQPSARCTCAAVFEQVVDQPTRERSIAELIYQNDEGLMTKQWKRKEGSVALTGSWWVGAESHEAALRQLLSMLEA